MELWQGQVSAGSNLYPNPRTDAVAALIAQRKLDRARIGRESYEDRSSHSYSRGYTAQELKKMQAILLEDQNRLVSSPLFELIVANPFLLELLNTPRHPSRTPLRPLWPESLLALSRRLVPCRIARARGPPALSCLALLVTRRQDKQGWEKGVHKVDTT
jgi:hypothetical protein